MVFMEASFAHCVFGLYVVIGQGHYFGYYNAFKLFFQNLLYSNCVCLCLQLSNSSTIYRLSFLKTDVQLQKHKGKIVNTNQWSINLHKRHKPYHICDHNDISHSMLYCLLFSE